MPTPATHIWRLGDKIIHADRPEWGTGHVMSASPTSHEGQPCQSLKIRFERAGVKTLSTGVAPLRSAEEPAIEVPDADADPLLGQDQRQIQDIMVRLPEATTDPFSTPAARLRATLAIYRFSKDPASLIDWAAAQSGLADPLTRFSRHDLELYFDRFAKHRTEHLTRVVREAADLPRDELVAIAAEAPEAAKEALRRLNRSR